jgi:hypothetical protein
MTETLFTFQGDGNRMKINADYDTGWLEHLNCSGRGGWEDHVETNDDNAAIVRITNIKTRATVSVCGIRWIKGWTFNTIFTTKNTDGFKIHHSEDSVAVTCEHGFAIEFVAGT